MTLSIIGLSSPSASILWPDFTWLSLFVCFPSPYCCLLQISNLERVFGLTWPLVAQQPLSSTMMLPLFVYLSLSVFISPVVLRQLFKKNSSCLITEVCFIHRFKQRPLVVTSMPQSLHGELLPSHFVAVLFGSALEARCVLAAAQTVELTL